MHSWSARQMGQEFFATVERVVNRDEVATATPGQVLSVAQRSLPLCVLGACRMGLAAKMQPPRV